MISRLLTFFRQFREREVKLGAIVDPDVDFAMVRRAPPRPPFWGDSSVVHELWERCSTDPVRRLGTVREALETLALCDRVFSAHATYYEPSVDFRASDWFRECLRSIPSDQQVGVRLSETRALQQRKMMHYVIEVDHASLMRREVITIHDQAFVVLFRGRLLIAAYAHSIAPPRSSIWLFRVP